MGTIMIDNQTRDELRSIGRKEQTYDDIIRELLQKAKSSVNSGKSTEQKVLQK
jgi:hypothetical protein